MSEDDLISLRKWAEHHWDTVTNTGILQAGQVLEILQVVEGLRKELAQLREVTVPT